MEEPVLCRDKAAIKEHKRKAKAAKVYTLEHILLKDLAKADGSVVVVAVASLVEEQEEAAELHRLDLVAEAAVAAVAVTEKHQADLLLLAAAAEGEWVQ